MKKYDVIIVLGGGTKDGNSLSIHSEERIEKGVKIFSELRPPMMILSGNQSFWNKLNKDLLVDVTESGLMYEYAISKGIPKESLKVEQSSKDTVGNALFTKKIVLKEGFKMIMVITSKLTATRVEFVFRKVYGPEYEIKIEFVDPVKISEEDLVREKKVADLTKKHLEGIDDGDEIAIRRLLKDLHPGYGGSGIDLSDLNRFPEKK